MTTTKHLSPEERQVLEMALDTPHTGVNILTLHLRMSIPSAKAQELVARLWKSGFLVQKTPDSWTLSTRGAAKISVTEIPSHKVTASDKTGIAVIEVASADPRALAAAVEILGTLNAHPAVLSMRSLVNGFNQQGEVKARLMNFTPRVQSFVVRDPVGDLRETKPQRLAREFGADAIGQDNEGRR